MNARAIATKPPTGSYSGERKTVKSTMWNQGVTYSVMDMTAHFFPSKDSKAGDRVFYNAPPVSYALLGYPVVAHYLAVEWVGKLFVSVASQPFYLGSAEQRAIITSLTALLPKYKDPKVLPTGAVWRDAPCSQWTVYGGCFYKLVACTLRTGALFAPMKKWTNRRAA